MPRFIVIDKLKSCMKPIKVMCSRAEDRSDKRLNNRIENVHQITGKKDQYLIKFGNRTNSVINGIDIGKYTNTTKI